MSFIISDSIDENKELHINSWNWRPTIELIRTSNILDEEKLEWIGYNAGTEISKGEARKIGEFLTLQILPKLKPGDRIEYNLKINSQPDTGEFHKDNPEKNYSAKYEWLKKFTEFCMNCEGFNVY
jgi:hypothetical protein